MSIGPEFPAGAGDPSGADRDQARAWPGSDAQAQHFDGQAQQFDAQVGQYGAQPGQYGQFDAQVGQHQAGQYQYQVQPQGYAMPAQAYPGQYMAAQAAARVPGYGLGVAGMILGIGSIVFCWWGIGTLVEVVLAIVFGVIARNKAAAVGTRNSMATAGLVCGIIGAVIYLLLGFFALGLMCFV